MDKLIPKPFIFVLMPFKKDFVNVYKVGIKPACDEAGAYCERVDDQIFEENILARIYNQIQKCDLVVADMTGRNPNVFYETGYAHALGKRVVLLTEDERDIPFDLMPFPHIIYRGDIALLKDKLKQHVEWWLAHPKEPLAGVSASLEYYLKGERLSAGMLTRLQPAATPDGKMHLKLVIDVHNACDQICDASLIELGVVMPREFANALNAPTVWLPDKVCMHQIKEMGRLLPDGWRSFALDIHVRSFEAIRERVYQCALKIFSAGSLPEIIPFKLQLT